MGADPNKWFAVASRWGQDLTRKSRATLRQCQTPVRGVFPCARPQCEAIFLVPEPGASRVVIGTDSGAAAWVDMPMPDRYGCIDIDERRVIPDIEIRDAVIKACGLRSISDFQLLTLERRKSVIQEVMRSLDVRPRQLSRVTGMNYETIRNIAKKLP